MRLSGAAIVYCVVCSVRFLNVLTSAGGVTTLELVVVLFADGWMEIMNERR